METNGRHFKSDYLLSAVQQLQPIAHSLDLTMTQLALAWILRRPEISAAIVGASRPEQVAQSAAASGVVIPPSALAAIDAVLQPVAVTSSTVIRKSLRNRVGAFLRRTVESLRTG
jgi:aryl-alcohol dehydrogenase-like predicted oxidoreductase